MNGKRDQFNEVGIGGRRVGIRDGQRLAFFDIQLSQVFESTRDHHAGVCQIEALRHRSRKIQGFRDHHSARSARKIERDAISKHAS